MAPLAHRSLSQVGVAGWWQAAVSFLIGTYYMVTSDGCSRTSYFSFGSQWGSDTEAFFTGQFGVSASGAWRFQFRY